MGGNNRVEIVQFEKFVLSEQYRQALAERLGIRTDQHKRHSYFKPWESARNVLLHEEYPNQNEIEFIRQELSEYCYEPCVHSLMEGCFE